MDVSNSDYAGTQREVTAKSSCVDFLGLAHCSTTRLDKLEHILLAHATYRSPEPSGECEKCHKTIFRPSTRPNRELLIWDLPTGGCPVLIRFTTWPMICVSPNCHTPFREEIPWYHSARNMTRRLQEHIRDRLTTLSTFQQIALDTCQDRKTISGILFDAVQELEGDNKKVLPRVLGIDEIYFNNKPYTLLVNIETGKAVDLLEGRSAESVRRRFVDATNKDEVEYVTQDFSQSYRAAATQPPGANGKKRKKKAAEAAVNELQLALFTEVPVSGETESADEDNDIRLSREALAVMLPNAKIVGDHFHFAQAIVDEGFNRIRIKVREGMKKSYGAKMLRHFLNLEEQIPLPKQIPKSVRRKVKDAVNKKADRLDSYKFLLSERQENLNKKPDKLQIVNDLLHEYPLLARAWNLKEAGLHIFPVQPSLGRTKKAREAAQIERAKLRLSPEEAARRLDAWVEQVNEQEDLTEFFQRAVNMVRNWREELIRIGTTGYSNAATESKNRYLRSLASISRGLPFETLRARLLWADANHRKDRWPSFCDGNAGKIDIETFAHLAYDYLEQRKHLDEPPG
jgi:transposase